MRNNKLWLVGLIIGDGSLSGRMVRIWNTENSIIEKAEEVLINEFGCNKVAKRIIKTSVGRGFAKKLPMVELRINSVVLKRKILELFDLVKKSEDLEALVPFTRGIVDSEACVDFNGNIVVWQKIGRKGKVVIKLLKKTFSKLKIETRRWKNRRFFILVIPGSRGNPSNIVKFNEKIGFTHKRKSKEVERLIKILKSEKATHSQLVELLRRKKEVTVREIVENLSLLRSEARRSLLLLERRGVVKRINKHTFGIV